MTVRVTDDEIIARLSDGRTISVPLVWSWRLAEASREAREKFEAGDPVDPPRRAR